MPLFFGGYVSWASWRYKNAVLVNPGNWIGVRPPHLCALPGFQEQCYAVCSSTSAVASGFGLQVYNLLHLCPHVELNRVFFFFFAWNTSRPYQTRCGWEHSGNAYHFWEKKGIYYSKNALHKCPTVGNNYKNMTAGTEQRERCAAKRGKPGKPNKHFIKCKTTSLNFKSFISWLLAQNRSHWCANASEQ